MPKSKTKLSDNYGGPSVKETSIEMSDWSKTYVKNDAEVGFTYGEGEEWDMQRSNFRALIYFCLIAMVIFISAGIYMVIDAHEHEEEEHMEEIVELKNCSLEHHIEWYQNKITKEDGKQYTEVGQIAHDPNSFT